MLLELEVLTGRRKGSTITLDPEGDPSIDIPYILELEALKITLHATNKIQQATVILEDSTISLFPEHDTSGQVVSYSALPSFKEGKAQALFYNYFGIAILYVEVHFASEIKLIEFGRVEVLARKASVEQIELMIEFICNANEKELLRARGATRLQADIGGDESEPPLRLIETLEQDVSKINELLPYFVNSPLTSLSSKLVTLPGNPNIDLQDQGLAWLAENSGVLELSDDPESTMFNWHGQMMVAKYIQTSVVYENADIYENQIILGYIDNLLSFTNELANGLSLSEKGTTLNKYDGYVSFFDSVVTKLLDQSSNQMIRVLNIQKKLMFIRQVLCTKIGIKKSDLSLPKFTPKVRSSRHYTTLFKTIYNWYQCSQINWEAQKLLLAIDNIPKLFELYSILVVRQWCAKNGEEDKEYEDVWQGTIFGNKVKLQYEPTYWMYGHSLQTGDIFNTQNRKVSSAKKDRLGIKRNHPLSHRKPDIVLDVQSSSKKRSLIVLDAKYTNEELAFERYLPECTMKYIHGLGAVDNSRLVQYMFILFPDKSDGGKYLDFHVAPFNAFGESPQLPMLGALGLSLGANQQAHDEGVGEVLCTAFNSMTK